MQEILIKNLMTEDVRCASPRTPLSQVIQSMKENRHSCMVITIQKTPVGIITERDIVHHFCELMGKGPDHDPEVRSIMSPELVTVRENTDLFEALVIARSNQIRHLPVVNNQHQLVGIITYTDLVAAHFRVIETQRDLLERAVAHRTNELLEVNKKLQELSLEDPLLKIGNRRAMEVDLEHTHASAQRYRRPYAITLLDVDHFKLFNDYYGHVAGDEILKQLAVFLKSAVRKTDRIYRYGGEEILILLPETSPAGAQALGQRLVDGLAELRIPHELHPLKIVTMSGGISGFDEAATDEPWFDVVQRADCALFGAKTGGRNRIASLYLTESVSAPETAGIAL
ncbi:MAG TPA: GGDEF domain-containing protein [Candidatus Acidoferrales bacterium]|nr:GGDEF domain-containing protein [Candidatus Acidoferrales bacterium]